MLKWIVTAMGTIVAIAAAWLCFAWAGGYDLPLDQLRARYASPASRYVTIDGVQLHVRDEGHGPVLLLVHGHYQSLRIWDGWVARMKGNVRVIRFDMPPYGLSGPDASGIYSPKRVETLIAGLIAHYRLRDVTLGGMSTGSAISVRYALAHPDQIKKLVLINAPLVPVPPAMQPKSPWMMQELENGIFRPIYRPRFFYDYLLHRLIADPAKVTPALIDETYDMHRKPGNAAALEQFTGNLRFDASSYKDRMAAMKAQLAAIKMPVLILWGGAGSMLPTSIACQLRAALSATRADLIVYPGAGHFLPIEAPQAAADLERFVASASPAPSSSVACPPH